MFFHMKTTLNISEIVMRKLKQKAAQTGTTMSKLVEQALRESLEKERPAAEKLSLPTFSGGKAMVNIANRAALFDYMEDV